VYGNDQCREKESWGAEKNKTVASLKSPSLAQWGGRRRWGLSVIREEGKFAVVCATGVKEKLRKIYDSMQPTQ